MENGTSSIVCRVELGVALFLFFFEGAGTKSV